MLNKINILLIITTGLLFSCHSSKNIGKGTIPPKDTTMAVILPPAADHSKEDSLAFIKDLYNRVTKNKIDINTFSGKIDVDYEEVDGKDVNVNAHVRIWKDSTIWISITGPLGIEGLRALITPDSIRILDKQEKTYSAKSIYYLEEMMALPLNFSILQDLLLGNPVFLDSNISSYRKTGNAVTLFNDGPVFKNLITVGLEDMLMQNSNLADSDLENNRSCILSYDEYETKKEQSFSTKRIVHIQDKKTINIKMNFKQYDFNEKLSFPFSVPKNYSQK